MQKRSNRVDQVVKYCHLIKRRAREMNRLTVSCSEEASVSERREEEMKLKRRRGDLSNGERRGRQRKEACNECCSTSRRRRKEVCTGSHSTGERSTGSHSSGERIKKESCTKFKVLTIYLFYFILCAIICLFVCLFVCFWCVFDVKTAELVGATSNKSCINQTKFH